MDGDVGFVECRSGCLVAPASYAAHRPSRGLYFLEGNGPNVAVAGSIAFQLGKETENIEISILSVNGLC